MENYKERLRLFKHWRKQAIKLNEIKGIVQNPVDFLSPKDVKHYNNEFKSMIEDFEELKTQTDEYLKREGKWPNESESE